MKRAAVAAGLLSAALAWVPPSARAAPVSADAVRQAIGRATDYLLAHQTGTDNWESDTKQPTSAAQNTGWTALVVDALLSAHPKSTDPKVAAAVAYLKSHPTDGVYALGLRMQVWQRLPDAPDVRAAAKTDLAKLLANVGTRGKAAGMYGYDGKTTGAYSHSRTQYAMLGVATGDAMGLPVPDGFWRLTLAAWSGHQMPDGGYTYTKENAQGHPETAGMTTVAVASLLLCHDALHLDESSDCRGTLPDPTIAKGLKWLADHPVELTDPAARGPRLHTYPTLYGYERVGAAGGIKYFGTVNWYQTGATWLLENQEDDGRWGSGHKTATPESTLTDTAFALLFLARGQQPLFMQKLDYSAVANADAKRPAGKPPGATEWDQRPRDVSNLAKQVGHGLELELGWQSVPLSAPAADFLDAPILYVSGKDVVRFDDAGQAKLKSFIDAGGMVVANADCNGIGFANGIKKLANQITPYEFRTLPKGHPIYTRQQFPAARWKRQPNVLGLSNGVRELMILIPNGDPGHTWNLGQVKGHESDFELGADLFQYVASRANFRSRGESYLVDRDPAIKATATTTVGRLKYAGNWDPEPGGWHQFTADLHNRAKVDATVKTVTPADDWAGLSVVALTGTEKVSAADFGPAMPAKVKAYTAAGGTLLVDAAGGSTAFATTVEPLLQQWAGGKLATIPADDPLYAPAGDKLGPVKYRPFAADRLGKLDAPRLRGIKLGDRWVVIYSPEDLSAGLVGQQVDGVNGYAPATATDLARHVVRYAMAAK